MSTTRTARTIVAAAALSLLAPLVGVGTAGATGPTAGTDNDRLLTEVPQRTTAVAPTATDDKVVARVSRDGHTLTFVEHAGIDVIGVYEQAPLGATPYLTSLRSGGTAGEGPTALDLYRALTTVSPPKALVADDDRRGPGATTKVVLPTGPIADQDPPDGSCAYNQAFAYDSQWAWNWHTNVGVLHDLHAQLSFNLEDLNGNVGRVFDANRSRARWLAACNGTYVFGFPNIYLTPEVYQSDGWTHAYPLWIEPGTQGVYWSAGGPERWRMRMTEGITYNVKNPRDWAIGGAIDKPFGFVANGG
ncbi:MAG: hypothetical protein OEY41_04225 [Acidimicrobiia bacterium]|nr:hypothetical protein [Acidimicrobiia bacterium]MDH4363883.1 hypothetical protein [Acidimicrobiia bacterium]MDH5289188.1 hypothetical protein [Acidimicrobiia bacterium]